MAKENSASKDAAGLAEWLPLLGSICQALASISEEAADGEDKPAPRKRLEIPRPQLRRKAR